MLYLLRDKVIKKLKNLAILNLTLTGKITIVRFDFQTAKSENDLYFCN